MFSYLPESETLGVDCCKIDCCSEPLALAAHDKFLPDEGLHVNMMKQSSSAKRIQKVICRSSSLGDSFAAQGMP
jgi:hypothetical protein